MSDFYGDIAITGKALLTQFGKKVTLRVVSDAVYDPATATAVTTNADKKLVAVLVDFPASQQNGPGGTILQGDKKCILQAGTPPAVQHRLLEGDNDWGIIGFKEVNPAGTPVLYVLHLRK